jgi:hypothetical protein
MGMTWRKILIPAPPIVIPENAGIQPVLSSWRERKRPKDLPAMRFFAAPSLRSRASAQNDNPSLFRRCNEYTGRINGAGFVQLFPAEGYQHIVHKLSTIYDIYYVDNPVYIGNFNISVCFQFGFSTTYRHTVDNLFKNDVLYLQQLSSGV